MAFKYCQYVVLFIGSLIGLTLGQDTLGLQNGYINISTRNFDVRLVRDAQVLASLKPAGSSFDFLPANFLSRRARDGQYHWGDLTIRYRQRQTGDEDSPNDWITDDSAAARQPVSIITTESSLAASVLNSTLRPGPLNVTREWLDIDGDLALGFTIQNTGSVDIEIGSLGFPAEFNSIFTGLDDAAVQRSCSLSDPYIGMHAGHIRITPLSGVGPALVVTPLGDTPLEAYRNLQETSYPDTAYGSQTFEGLYEWQVLTRAWAENEWKETQPWNTPSSRVVLPGTSILVGVRFSLAEGGPRDFDKVIYDTGTPVALGVPGYIIPQDLSAKLFLADPDLLRRVVVDPPDALAVTLLSPGEYDVVPSASAWGRVRVSLQYSDYRWQTIHYYITKPAPDAVADLGTFLTTAQYFSNTSDPFGRAPSVMTYDYETRSIVSQDSRVWVAGLSDEGGAGSFLAAAMKQAIQPNVDEIAKLEQFVDKVLWKTIQTPDFAVRKSTFYYDPATVSGFTYDSSVDWGSWTSWNKDDAYKTDRAYDYVHVTATYWALYRAGRAYPDVLKVRAWDWYLNQAYQTVISGMQPSVRYGNLGLMGETVFGELLHDLEREGQTNKSEVLKTAMQSRATRWDKEEVPFGSEQAWDSTGQEGVYYWSKYFSYENTATKALNTVLGFMPTVPHWGWNGNARRYWDNIYAGKLGRIERQIHHYGSSLNSLVLLSAFRNNASDSYLLQVGYGGNNGPLSSINQDGFASASFHSWPDTLKWDGFSGDYGPGFAGLVLGSGTYIAEHSELGLLAYGGILKTAGSNHTVQTRDAARRRVFIGPLDVLISIDAGIILQFSYDSSSKIVSVTLAQLEGVPKAPAAVVWVESTSSATTYGVTTAGLNRTRLGWQVPLDAVAPVTIQVGPL